jgi:hypothetical protein
MQALVLHQVGGHVEDFINNRAQVIRVQNRIFRLEKYHLSPMGISG